MKKAYKDILVVVKQTPYEFYMQLKSQGKAPVALRWERLQNRYLAHRQCVDNVIDILKGLDVNHHVIGREELYRGSFEDKDLVIAVGGDGTILNTSSFMDDTIPLLGVNSDPSLPHETNLTQPKDERRSKGALCATSAMTVNDVIPRVIYGDIPPGLRSRIQCLVRSTHTETRLPPALNDILLTHPSAAAVSRFRMTLNENIAEKSAKKLRPKFEEVFSFNVWSSGMWISTATGSTAAMTAAGGQKMDKGNVDLQYIVREHLIEEGFPEQKRLGRGFINPNQNLNLRWNSQNGSVYVDGAHMLHDLELGDELIIDAHAPYLKLFDPPKLVKMAAS
jgi:NAD+ kinase